MHVLINIYNLLWGNGGQLRSEGPACETWTRQTWSQGLDTTEGMRCWSWCCRLAARCRRTIRKATRSTIAAPTTPPTMPPTMAPVSLPDPFGAACDTVAGPATHATCPVNALLEMATAQMHRMLVSAMRSLGASDNSSCCQWRLPLTGYQG